MARLSLEPTITHLKPWALTRLQHAENEDNFSQARVTTLKTPRLKSGRQGRLGTWRCRSAPRRRAAAAGAIWRAHPSARTRAGTDSLQYKFAWPVLRAIIGASALL
eukprot:6179071-Pleurochrysis_carterae.AAC.1